LPISNLRFSRSAEADLQRIEDEGFELFGVQQTIAYIEALWDILDLIAVSPGLAPLRRDLRPPVRVHSWRAHLIVYIEEDRVISILRILHRRQDVAKALSR
jgi:toxin ParE1/3/4